MSKATGTTPPKKDPPTSAVDDKKSATTKKLRVERYTITPSGRRRDVPADPPRR